MAEREKYEQLEARITKLEADVSEYWQRCKAEYAAAQKMEGELILQREKMHSSIVATMRAVRARGTKI
ncbi:hypothetical protein GOZ83_10720 [Agrobacterium vitis]|uniref:hypothetical protein n=1 Tax=Rhizobium/Agrobacterium group TaxID=227290 RepID=UPI0012E8A6D7|nr:MULTISPECIES: hypothetical protein [Rhizobium/Agrobacterium group]MCF1449413.1 hypothetical protein [Allorhizobium ampelinum]MCF1492302.1 hypothetical protein [Allorhizobium ampelinum]MVA45547.1 hypothetical protein [Agrobacterium vitis]